MQNYKNYVLFILSIKKWKAHVDNFRVKIIDFSTLLSKFDKFSPKSADVIKFVEYIKY